MGGLGFFKDKSWTGEAALAAQDAGERIKCAL